VLAARVLWLYKTALGQKDITPGKSVVLVPPALVHSREWYGFRGRRRIFSLLDNHEAAMLSVCGRFEFCSGYYTSRFNSAQPNSFCLPAIRYLGMSRPWLVYFNHHLVLKLSGG
jgi:hypothetical protein